jgi:hypothetical protein
VRRLRVLAAAPVVAVVLGLGSQAVGQLAPSPPSPVTATHLTQINQLLRGNGVARGRATLDARGRVELQGEFQNEAEVDRAFSLAQTIVGVRWVSPVTPQHIRIKGWEECLARLFGGGTCGGQAAPSPSAGDDIPPGPVADKHALVVGVGRFQGGITPLQYANKDAYDVYSYLVDPAGGAFHRDNVILLRDEYATRHNVQRALDEIRRRAREDDVVLVYLSSHGTPPDKFGGVNVVTFDSAVTPRERIWETSLTEGALREFVQGVRAKRLVLVLDACYSNGAYGQIAGFLPRGGKSLDASADEGYGRSRRHMVERIVGAKDLVIEPGPGARAGGGAGPPAGWGKVLISASDAGERSWESDALKNSVFTRFFIDGLRTHRGAVREAFDYSRPLVRQQVKREKGQEVDQTPQIAANRNDWNMSVATSGR